MLSVLRVLRRASMGCLSLQTRARQPAQHHQPRHSSYRKISYSVRILARCVIIYNLLIKKQVVLTIQTPSSIVAPLMIPSTPIIQACKPETVGSSWANALNKGAIRCGRDHAVDHPSTSKQTPFFSRFSLEWRPESEPSIPRSNGAKSMATNKQLTLAASPGNPPGNGIDPATRKRRRFWRRKAGGPAAEPKRGSATPCAASPPSPRAEFLSGRSRLGFGDLFTRSLVVGSSAVDWSWSRRALLGPIQIYILAFLKRHGPWPMRLCGCFFTSWGRADWSIDVLSRPDHRFCDGKWSLSRCFTSLLQGFLIGSDGGWFTYVSCDGLVQLCIPSTLSLYTLSTHQRSLLIAICIICMYFLTDHTDIIKNWVDELKIKYWFLSRLLTADAGRTPTHGEKGI
jgi:hypothetical protein